MGRIAAVVVVAALAAAAPASAQTDWHIYGGGVLGGEYTRGRALRARVDTGPVFVAAHGLWLNDEGVRELAQVIPRGLDFEVASAGVDVEIGPTVRFGNTDVMPVGVVGYTTAELEVCYRSDCTRVQVDAELRRRGHRRVRVPDGELSEVVRGRKGSAPVIPTGPPLMSARPPATSSVK